MPNSFCYQSVERVRFDYDGSTGEVQARIKLLNKTFSDPIDTGIRCTKEEFQARDESSPGGKRLILALIKWERSILSAAYKLTSADQPVKVRRLLEARNLAPDDFPTLDDLTALSFHFGFRSYSTAADGYGEITAQFRIGNRVSPAGLAINVRCLKGDWQLFTELRSTPSSERLSASLTAYQNAILHTTQVFQRMGADLSPQVVHKAAMGPYGNGPYTNKDFYAHA